MIRGLWLISKFKTLTTGQQIITIHLLSNISVRQKDIVHLIEHEMRNNFLKKKHAKNMVEKLIPDPLVKNQN